MLDFAGMKHFILLCLISAVAQARELLLEVGETKVLPLLGSRVWVERGAILKAEVRSQRLMVTAKKPGSSRIRSGDDLYSVQVIDQDRRTLYEFLKSEVERTPGLKVALREGEVDVEGYLHDWKQWKALLRDRHFESSYRMKARMAPQLQNQLQKLIDQDLTSQGLLSMNVHTSPHLHVRLHPDQPGLDLYRRYFQRMGIEVHLLKESLTMEPSVRVQITVAEISKKFSRNLGMNWLDGQGQARFDILPTGLVNSETLQATLNALETEGHAKLLASPNLICRSGKEAEFLAGGEFPIKILNFQVQDIVWKKYGVLLKIKPVADSSGKMSLSIETEVSSLGPLVDGLPSIESNKVSSHFDISHSQVIALSGLLRDQTSRGHQGLPWLSQLPVLGALFSSQNYLSQKTELVIFVRPTLMNEPSRLSDTKSSPQHLETAVGNSKDL